MVVVNLPDGSPACLSAPPVGVNIQLKIESSRLAGMGGMVVVSHRPTELPEEEQYRRRILFYLPFFCIGREVTWVQHPSGGVD